MLWTLTYQSPTMPYFQRRSHYIYGGAKPNTTLASGENVMGFLIDNSAIRCISDGDWHPPWCTGECAFNTQLLANLRYFEDPELPAREIPHWLFVPCTRPLFLLDTWKEKPKILIEDGDLFIRLHQSIPADEVGDWCRMMGYREEVIDILEKQGIPGVFSYCSDLCNAKDTPATISLKPSA